MNRDVAQGARLKESGLVVERWRSRCGAERCGVTLQTEQVDVTEFQHVGIGPAVRNVARLAAIHLYRRVFVDKWSLLVDVAGKANGVLRGRRAHLLGANRSMNIVAVAALDQAFIYAMMKRHRELRLLVQMAGITKRGLRFDQQEFLGFRVVRRMAGRAADVVLRMHRIDGVHVLRAARVAGEALSVDLFRGVLAENENFGFVTAAGHVRRPGAMATFTSLVRRPAFGIECGFPVRCCFPVLVDLCVTSFAGF